MQNQHRGKRFLLLFFLVAGILSCKKDSSSTQNPATPTPAETFSFNSLKVNGAFNGFTYQNVNAKPVLKFNFATAISRTSVASGFSFRGKTGETVAYAVSYEDNDNTVVIQPSADLAPISTYTVEANTALLSTKGGKLQTAISVSLTTAIDSTDKFPHINDDALLDLVQRQTFKYFWDFGHPVSGLARERNTSGETVTSGGSGFGIMAIVTGVNRNFVSRADGLARLQKIVGFLKTAQKFHGAFPHWLNGSTGVAIPFSTKDNGADLVETSYLMEGLLVARQYFSQNTPGENMLRDDINALYQGVEWDWFRKGSENVLYWHWSPNYNWDMNLPIRGWNECLVTYVLAASSTSHTIPKEVYTLGFARDGAMRNGSSFYGINLPLGATNGGPLFFSHYSFLGINPKGLRDDYADYEAQTKNHTLINRAYCVANPKSYPGYSADCWGLTASDIPTGYSASEPNNDLGVIAPTAALSSMPYTPAESMQALRFFYYKIGNKTWGDYGFYDAFSLKDNWFASSYLAIDQGPIIGMIENHRSGLLWNLFMSCPEVKTGMKKLGFSGPNL